MMTHALAPCRNYGVIPDARTHTKTRILLGNAPRDYRIFFLAMRPLLHAGQCTAHTQWMNTCSNHSPSDRFVPHIARPSNPLYMFSMWESDEGAVCEGFAQCIDKSYSLPQWEAFDGARVRGGGGKQRDPRAAYASQDHDTILPGTTP